VVPQKCKAGARFYGRVYALSKCPVHNVIFLIARIHGSRKKRLEMGAISLKIILTDSLRKSRLIMLIILYSIGPQAIANTMKCKLKPH
jgi:hypothetical protein